LCDHERENVPRAVDNDRPVTFGRKRLVAIEPGARRRRMTTRGVVRVGARGLDGGHACGERGSGSVVVRAHDKSRTQAMGKNVAGIVRKHARDLARRIPARRQHEV